MVNVGPPLGQRIQLIEKIIQNTKEGKICWRKDGQPAAYSWKNDRDNPYIANCDGMTLKLFTNSGIAYYLQISDGNETMELVECHPYRGLPHISSLFEIVDEPAKRVRQLEAETRRKTGEEKEERLLSKLARVI